ncbi:AraC family transcriptional regulator [Neptuniibacter sp. CAU 1671]|uniref:AraC-like transcriptional regulator QhpR n=1 Tax=Neptuniibacter sp. CAU 1671 TaxID=3032593 RepID=UPI0023DC6FF2|nr:AraC family transcriptional regulator [Neptuniibacter sp. CAU 1671]MDF2180950.1 AraC family transcriptional regulator [Neptuniibacter sp. CAU 1671]
MHSNPHYYPGQNSSSGVLASVTIGLEEFIEAQGASSNLVLSRSGLQSGLYKNPNRHISLKNYINSIHEAARATGNEHFGLWFGEQFQPEGLGLLGFHATTSADLRSAIQGMQDHFLVFQRNSYLQLHRADGICYLEYRLLDGEIMDRRQDAELTLGMLNNVLRRAMGSQWAPLEVHFQHPALVDAVQHRAAFQCETRFRQERNAILFRDTCLDAVMPDANPMLNSITQGSMLELAGIKQPEMNLAQRVKCEIIELLPDGELCLEQVAKGFNLSSRTLQRQLSAEKHSFKGLVDEVREELATCYLSYERLSISEVAYRLGYSEISAFTRAFMRWKNVSPSDWRMQ